MRGECYLVIAVSCCRLVGGVPEPILSAQFFCDLVVDLGDCLFLRHFKQPTTCLVSHLLKYLLAIYVGGVASLASAATSRIATPAPWITSSTGIASTPPAGIASSWKAWAASTSMRVTALLILLFLTFEVDGIDDGVRALRCFDRFRQRLLATAIDTIREDHE